MYWFLAFSYFYLKTYGKAFDKCNKMQYFWQSVDSVFDNLFIIICLLTYCSMQFYLKPSLLCLEVSNTNGNYKYLISICSYKQLKCTTIIHLVDKIKPINIGQVVEIQGLVKQTLPLRGTYYGIVGEKEKISEYSGDF